MDQQTNQITKPGLTGFSKPLTVGGQKGRFNWSEKPKFDPGIGGGKSPMYLFVTDKGEAFYRRLELNKQGGRWEEGEYAEREWEEWIGNPKQIPEHWGQSKVTEVLTNSIRQGHGWNQVKDLLKELDTWRQISDD